jgi:hypothetical protein
LGNFIEFRRVFLQIKFNRRSKRNCITCKRGKKDYPSEICEERKKTNQQSVTFHRHDQRNMKGHAVQENETLLNLHISGVNWTRFFSLFWKKRQKSLRMSIVPLGSVCVCPSGWYCDSHLILSPMVWMVIRTWIDFSFSFQGSQRLAPSPFLHTEEANKKVASPSGHFHYFLIWKSFVVLLFCVSFFSILKKYCLFSERGRRKHFFKF